MDLLTTERIAAQQAGVSPSAPDSDPGLLKTLPTEAWSKIIPADKGLSPEWIRALTERGGPKVYRGEALLNIGMPVGGICSGLVYLGGDGKLWYWDIFNRFLCGVQPRNIHYRDRSWHGLPPGLGAWQGGNYVEPVRDQPCPFEQGFALKLSWGRKTEIRTMDRKGWKDVSFEGAYPVGIVRYSDPACPVVVTLRAYSPFCPLDFENSSYPATIMSYHVENTGASEVKVEIGGWLENAALLDMGRHCPGVRRRNTVATEPNLTLLKCDAIVSDDPLRARPDVVFEDFEKETYEGWTVEGTTFGKGPVAKEDMPAYMGEIGMRGTRCANSHAGAPVPKSCPSDETAEAAVRDAATGKLISREFVIERNLIRFLISGGNYPGRCCMNLVIDGEVVRSATGHNGHAMRVEVFDVSEFAGRTAHLELVDDMEGIAVSIGVDHIVFTDVQPPERSPDWGSMALAAIGPATAGGAARLGESSASGLFEAVAETEGEATAEFDEAFAGGVVQSFSLAPGAGRDADFVIAWHFANMLTLARGSETGAHYKNRFDDACAVARHVAKNFRKLSDLTMRWRDTWYDSTLPHWFLDRVFNSLNCLASTTCFRFADGRFYTFEGVRACLGHPNHVWHYAQGHGRIFPELEQDVLERVWYGFAFHEEGSMAFRGEHGDESAIDGHCGAILCVLRAHQTNPDACMLERIWPNVKKSIEYANTRDRDGDGLLDTPMLTTLDEPWHGRIPWLSSLYLAALTAGAEMADEMGDSAFAKDCRERAARGRAAMDARLFNGEWFIQLPDPDSPRKLGAYETCHIDQVLGQGWAWQLGLGRVLSGATTRSALRALWKYNFSRNLDAYDDQSDPKGRPYFTAGEGGMVMTANALGKSLPFGVYSPFACYLSETMNGFEYQVAAHMIAEGMVEEGLAVIKTIDERYDGRKRNPFNEVECGDHYARSMAAYGALISICGFEYHGPRGHIGFAPKLNPEHFRAPFTAAEGWGTYSQEIGTTGLRVRISVKFGKLRVRMISLTLPETLDPAGAEVSKNDEVLAATLSVRHGKVRVELETTVVVKEDESLEVLVGD